MRGGDGGLERRTARLLMLGLGAACALTLVLALAAFRHGSVPRADAVASPAAVQPAGAPAPAGGVQGTGAGAPSALGAPATQGAGAGDQIGAPRRATAPSSGSVSVGASAAAAHLQSLPAQAQTVISSTIGASERTFAVRRSGAGYSLGGGGVRAQLGTGAVELHSGAGSLSMTFAGFGRGAHLARPAAASESAQANRITYTRGGLQEWYSAGPLGLEQGFTVAKRPAGSSGPLTLELALGGSLRARQVGSGVEFLTPAGKVALRYEDLSATDASGRPLPVALQAHGNKLLLDVSDAGAAYPLRIDPLIQQGEKLTGGGETGDGGFGFSVALSADGNTALVGAPAESPGDAGAAWVFTRSGSTWTQQGEKLTPSDESSVGEFGYSVALSQDGNTALITGPGNEGGAGAAWVFTRSGSTWTQQGGKITGGEESGTSNFGYSAALSGDGNTALIGGTADDHGAGAAWVFTRSEGSWSQQGEKLTGEGEVGGANFGFNVALSSDGNTALIGGVVDDHGAGAAWVFTRSEGSWSEQGEKLTGSEEDGEGWFGYSVALSGDGNTALVGGINDNGETGAAWAFARSEGSWSQQGEKLTGSEEEGPGQFGYSVALSENGNTALIGGAGDNGATGAAWEFTRFEGSWSQQGEKLSGSEEEGHGQFGFDVALSSDASTALVGGPNDDGARGGVWTFSAGRPSVTGLNPGDASRAGGSKITISGSGFTAGSTVSFGGTPAEAVTVNSASSITATAPAGNGVVAVTVTTAYGTSEENGADELTYVPPGQVSGLNLIGYCESIGDDGHEGVGPVILSKNNEISGPGYAYNNWACVENDGNVVVIATSGPAPSMDDACRFENPSITTYAYPSDENNAFTWNCYQLPHVASVEPSSGSTAGGTAVKITGSGFLSGATVQIGGEATEVDVASETEITARTAAGSPGSDEVVVSDTDGTSSGGPQFTYLAQGPPTVESITPSSGPTGGGQQVTITGTGFLSGAKVTIGHGAKSVQVISETEIRARMAAEGAAGTYPVVVKDERGTSSAGASYTYVNGPALPVVKKVKASSGPSGGGQQVTIKGTGFVSPAVVTIGSEATEAQVISATEIKARTAATAPGGDEVVVSDANGSSGGGPTFTYVSAPALPVVSSVSPGNGPTGGGQEVTIKGSGFVAGAKVKIGGAAEAVDVVSATEIKARTASGTAGGDEVVVSEENGRSTGGPTYTYESGPGLPVVKKVTPSSGPSGGGQQVKIKGSGFVAGAKVTIGNEAAEVQVVSETEIKAKTVATAAGEDEVVVADARGTSALGPSYTYQP